MAFWPLRSQEIDGKLAREFRAARKLEPALEGGDWKGMRKETYVLVRDCNGWRKALDAQWGARDAHRIYYAFVPGLQNQPKLWLFAFRLGAAHFSLDWGANWMDCHSCDFYVDSKLVVNLPYVDLAAFEGEFEENSEKKQELYSISLDFDDWKAAMPQNKKFTLYPILRATFINGMLSYQNRERGARTIENWMDSPVKFNVPVMGRYELGIFAHDGDDIPVCSTAIFVGLGDVLVRFDGKALDVRYS